MKRDEEFHALHQGPDLLILPNAWDAGSARVIEAAGAKAIATSSAAVAWSHGYPDGQFLSFDRLLETLAEIVRAVRVPVSADIEAGYGSSPADIGATIARILDTGVVGVNMEDGVEAPEILCAKIGRAHEVAEKAGIKLWINARVDVYLRHLTPAPAAFEETARRAALYRDAGANSIFAPAMVDRDEIGRMVKRVGIPLNILSWQGAPNAAVLHELGVKRLSAGGWLGRAALNRAYTDAMSFLRTGAVETFTNPEICVPSLNDLMPQP